MMRKQSRRNGGINNLPDDLLVKILYNLPGEYVVRCKVVCKRWLSILLSDPHFVHRSIHTHHRFHNGLNFFFQYKTKRIYKTAELINPVELHSISSDSIPYDLFKPASDSKPMFDYIPLLRQEPPTQIHVVACFQDLLVCCQRGFVQTMLHCVYHICNPLTKRWLSLPSVPPGYDQHYYNRHLTRVGFVCYPYYCNGEQVCTTNARYTYNLVCIPTLTESVTHFSAEIFPSLTGEWTKCSVSSPRPLCSQPSYPKLSNAIFTYNGILHWVNDGGKQMVAYDPLNHPQTCSVIDLPNLNRTFGVVGADCLGVCNGKLRLSQAIDDISNGYISTGIREIWELGDYNLGTWHLVHKIFLKDIISINKLPFCFIKVIAFHPLDPDIIFIVFLHSEEQLISFNMQTTTLQVVINLGKEEYCPNQDYEMFYPILHPWWPTPVPPQNLN